MTSLQWLGLTGLSLTYKEGIRSFGLPLQPDLSGDGRMVTGRDQTSHNFYGSRIVSIKTQTPKRAYSDSHGVVCMDGLTRFYPGINRGLRSQRVAESYFSL